MGYHNMSSVYQTDTSGLNPLNGQTFSGATPLDGLNFAEPKGLGFTSSSAVPSPIIQPYVHWDDHTNLQHFGAPIYPPFSQGHE